MKKILTVGIVVLMCVFVYFALHKNVQDDVVVETTKDDSEVQNAEEIAPETNEVVPEAVVDTTKTILGYSKNGNAIPAYHFGEGKDEILFVGGIHGGYEWNTSLLAYEMMEYFSTNPSAIPKNITVTIVPVLNPDGLMRVVGSTSGFDATDVSKDANIVVEGRFNANNVDLNRNFDCEWSARGVWQNKDVSGGTKAFSEPESIAVREYVDAHDIKAAVVWYSAAGGVYSSNCKNGVLPETEKMTMLYAQASGYPAYKDFNYYEITGDMVNWLAKEKVPAISVLLTNHQDTELEKNKKGIEALLKEYTR
jgi:hypothetical protein